MNRFDRFELARYATDKHAAPGFGLQLFPHVIKKCFDRKIRRKGTDKDHFLIVNAFKKITLKSLLRPLFDLPEQVRRPCERLPA